MLTVIILTQNEELHIARAIKSVQGVADRVFVVDSGSTDRTRQIAKQLGAEVLNHPWRNYAEQFNWALRQVEADTDWVMRLDADEVVSAELNADIKRELPQMSAETVGIFVPRYMNFLGGAVRRGGMFPIDVLRIFRPSAGHCEQRWMDEHIKFNGETAKFSGFILDDNLKPLSWWIDKHNAYASREVVDLLNLQLKFLPRETISGATETQAGRKRWIKEVLYARLPLGLRAGSYFLWRYVFRLGFLDTQEGRSFHLLQGFWYRYLVDMKLREVQRYMRINSVDPPTAIQAVLGIDVLK